MHKIRIAFAALALVSIAACSSQSITAPEAPVANSGTIGTGYSQAPANTPSFNSGTIGTGF